jgi:type II secretory pathway component PulM
MKKILVSSCMVFFCLIFYFLMMSRNVTLREKIAEEQHNISWMMRASDKIIQLKQTTLPLQIKKTTVKTVSLLALINQEAKKNIWGSYISDLKPLKKNLVEISFNSINFDELIEALEQLWDKYNVEIVKINVQRQTGSQVKVNLICEIYPNV